MPKEIWSLFKKVWRDLIFIFLALFYLGHFIAFVFIGPITISEDNKIVLGLEITLCIVIAALGVESLINDIKQRNNK